MKKYIRSFASMAVMGVFLVLALSCSCIWEGECFENNSESGEFKCEWYQPPITVQHKIFVRVIDMKTKEPIENAKIYLHFYKRNLYVYDPAKPDVCIFLDSESLAFKNFDYITNGYYSLKINTMYNSPLEMSRIVLNVQAEGYHTSLYRHNYVLKPNSEGKSITVGLVEYNFFP